MTPSRRNWFEKHKEVKLHYYDTGETLAEILENGCGKLFYKEGPVALDYYDPKEENIKRRYVVYSHEKYERGKKTQKILACFDWLGNGVVYNPLGQYMLKFNQTEGIIIDPKIGPPGRWKWHGLNDPPVLQDVFINTLEEDPTLEVSASSVELTKDDLDETMCAIELENFEKALRKKMLKTYKPFEIKMKAVKINDYFSLRIIDQGNIYLLFRQGSVCLKFCIGMLLINNEIVDVIVAEADDVWTPYDKVMHRSADLNAISRIFKKSKLKFIEK